MLRWFYIGLGCLVVASVLYLETVHRTGREPAALVGGMPELTMPELRLTSGGTPVLVFQLANPAAVADVRAVVASERVVAETPAGFALKEGRIVASGHEATAALLTATGWSDRPLEIHQAEPRLPDYRSYGRFGTGTSARRGGARDLAQKSHLSQQEAWAVMNELD